MSKGNGEQAPLVTLSFGAGVQSTTMLMLVLNRDPRLMKAMGGELPEHVIFADPGAETAQTYAHVARMDAKCTAAGLSFHVVSAGNLGDDIFEAKRFASIPVFTIDPATGSKGMLRRQCTREYKIEPITQCVRRIMGLKKRQHVKRHVRQWIGISTDEIQRVKEARDKWATNVYPLIEMNWRRGDCIRYLQSIGMTDVGKSACVFCPYHDDAFWLDMKRNDPESWEQACAMDERIRDLHKTGRGGVQNPLYLHRACKPLREVDLNENQGDLFNMFGFDNECDGMCGV